MHERAFRKLKLLPPIANMARMVGGEDAVRFGARRTRFIICFESILATHTYLARDKYLQVGKENER